MSVLVELLDGSDPREILLDDYITFEDYNQFLDIASGRLDELKIFSKAKEKISTEVTKFINRVANKLNIAKEALVELLRDKTIYDFFKGFKFQLEKMYTNVKAFIKECDKEKFRKFWNDLKLYYGRGQQAMINFLSRHPLIMSLSVTALNGLLFLLYLKVFPKLDPKRFWKSSFKKDGFVKSFVLILELVFADKAIFSHILQVLGSTTLLSLGYFYNFIIMELFEFKRWKASQSSQAVSIDDEEKFVDFEKSSVEELSNQLIDALIKSGRYEHEAETMVNRLVSALKSTAANKEVGALAVA
jgi:hypothetical protein